MQQEQLLDRRKAELIEMNEALVNNALTVMRSALANQIDWKEIQELLDEAKANKDPVASRYFSLRKIDITLSNYSIFTESQI